MEARIENGQAVKGVSAPVKKNGRVGNFFAAFSGVPDVVVL